MSRIEFINRGGGGRGSMPSKKPVIANIGKPVKHKDKKEKIKNKAKKLKGNTTMKNFINKGNR